MLDIGWSEILVIAVILIVIVGPKDLPPMIRAFGKMTANLRKMAGEFRSQFDEALREADMDDVRRTISDVQNLNPTNSLRDAMNPLRQLGQDIKSDLQKATTLDDQPTSTPVPSTAAVSVPEPLMTLPDTPPTVVSEAVPPAPVAETAKPAAKAKAAKAAAAKPAKTKTAASKASTTGVDVAAAEPVVKPVKTAAKTAAKPAAAPKVAPAKAVAAKKAPAKAASDMPAVAKKPVVRKTAATAKTAKKDEA
jgi:sec-independent protein translocase protein TatB